MAEFVYQMYKARKAVGEKVILDDVTVGVYPGAKIGVVGPNGMGKSTLLKVIAGMEDVSNGEAKLTPGYTVGLLQQEPPLDETKTVKENIELAFGDLLAKIARFNEIGVEMGNPDADFDALMAEMGQLQTEIDAANGWDLDSQLSQAMDALQCPDPDSPVTHLSGGEKRRVALCRLLLEAPDLLLLDEPTNHLDAESVLWLEKFLHDYPGAVMGLRTSRTPSAQRKCVLSWSGFVRLLRLARQRTAHVLIAMSRWKQRLAHPRSSTSPKSRFLLVRVWVRRFWKPTTSTKPSATAFLSTTSRLACQETASLV